jgi:hypothetical protein
MKTLLCNNQGMPPTNSGLFYTLTFKISRQERENIRNLASAAHVSAAEFARRATLDRIAYEVNAGNPALEPQPELPAHTFANENLSNTPTPAPRGEDGKDKKLNAAGKSAPTESLPKGD